MAESRRIAADWNAPTASRRVTPGAVAAPVAAAAAGVALWAALGPVPVIAAGGLVGIWIAFSWASQGARLLRRLGARPARHERLMNLVDGLARDLGRPRPEVFEADGAPNAFVAPRAGGGAIVVTRALLDASTRTELEAVVAACLVRLDDAAMKRVRATEMFGFLAGGAGLVAGPELDVRAAALTRYPPALAAAIEKAAPARGRAAPFAFVAAPPWGRAPDVRAAEVRDL